MSAELSASLTAVIERELLYLEAVTQEDSTRPRGEGKWSPRQELGHLIDSAANNHQRFVRAALDGNYSGPGYSQEEWVAIHGYQETPWTDLVRLWSDYNRLIARVIANIPEERLSASCRVAGDAPVSLHFLIADYIVHMRHHIDLLLRREQVTPYPVTA